VTTIVAHCPTRIDLAGGTLDIWPIHLLLPEPAVTVNVALDLPVRVEVELRPGTTRIVLASEDQGERVEHDDRAALQADLRSENPRLPLLALAVEATGCEGVRVLTRSRSPRGAGLGGSSALTVALLGALGQAVGQDHRAKGVLKLAQDLETRLLRTPTGYQDYYPPFYGGCLALEGLPGSVATEHFHDVDLGALAARLRLVYTGEPHHSGITNWGVVKAFLEGRAHAVASLEGIAANARRVREALRAGDVDAALEGAVEDGALRKRMAPRISTPTLKAIDQAARKAGALGTKILGAGGGGCLLVVLGPDTDPVALDGALAAGPGECLPLRLAADGLSLIKRPAAT
jgi:D-glycero-alpha-D-manno-heptose-7-phosphate kinase